MTHAAMWPDYRQDLGVVIPPEIVTLAAETIGAFFEPISRSDRRATAKDFLDLSHALKHADIIRRYTPLAGVKLLEIGSGFGTNLAVWIKKYGTDGYGVEPGGVGFDHGLIASRRIFSANGIDPDRIVNAIGENLPYPDESFDVVYSANVLEHTQNPEMVLQEALRVVRKGGLVHMELPNYLSYFEGHYLVMQPPIMCNRMLRGWVRLAFHRDPSFARTIRTRINPIWCRRNLKKLNRIYPLELLSLGEDVFLQRLARPYSFEMERVKGKLGQPIRLFQKVNRGNWLGKLIVAFQGHYPIYLTARKLPR